MLHGIGVRHVWILTLALALPAPGFAQDTAERDEPVRSERKKIKTSKRLSAEHYRAVELREPAEFVALQTPVEEARRSLLDAEARTKTAKQDFAKAKKFLSVEELDHTAAKWELKAAKANEDGRRTRVAEKRLKQTALDLDVARSMQKWRRERHDACRADIRRDKARIAQHEAERDLRAVELMHDHGSLHAERYEVSTFQSKAASRLTAYEKARRKADDAWNRAGRFERDFARLARKQGRDVEVVGRETSEPPAVQTDGVDEEPTIEDLSGGGR